MTASTTTERASLRSQRLNQITHEPHTKLDALVKAHAPFETQANFARFVVAQYLFQSELVALYNDPELIKLVPDLAERCRADAAKLDLADLETEVPAPVAGAVQNPSKAEALGWLFVSEGSKLGAAFLIKRAVGLGLSETFGARHLGEPAGGRAEGWKRFTRTLDSLELSAEEEAAAEKGAVDAFVRFTVLLEQAYASAPELA
ncbi:biliverdin-producing heme oxygenase [Pseudomonas fluorescens]|jgi:heme oxygenase (biliverdin-IX-beta and delta-forming)|uniref:biliverdin-producing heme oxygenase n=1 Tax=Pseudomonas TaxID=286 RepID=UPI0007CFBD6F|nr:MULTISPECIES: biliverdin-producing heme oxygenase [Pseudomonas]AYG09491.1 biliverdin-producing heme oxygenase [Pseudomonas fluorescens]OAE16637.1 heme oxygenase [Pseudomonas brenneri]MBJ2242035.1 biliverdin-producing heme oxygenase [Pseudomonas sp. MF6768]MBJ2262799.1 biliverdin-producing heme oxygenase [Pseudomonas sp. MF6787]MBK3454159.1 biliverdin-producing heme oxygenase [Pseudomonas sp. MF6754]